MLGLALALCTPAGAGRLAVAAPQVRLVRIEGVREFPEATEPSAILYACAEDTSQLQTFFGERRLAFERRLVRRRQGRGSCHIYYEPTLPGFRAAIDRGSVREIIGSVDPMSLVARRKPTGDSLDVIKTVLSRLPRPVKVSLSTTEIFDAGGWQSAIGFHFPGTRHAITVRGSKTTAEHPWAQDYVKPGQANGELRILLPRRLYEGRNPNGAASGLFLDGFDGRAFVRSKLSWEGGDLQFAADPGNANARVLVYGGMARHYWGRNLEPDEYEYVLRTEFGADRAINLSQFGPHVDFLVALLPDARTALVAHPAGRDLELAGAAAAELLRLYGKRSPRELRQLAAYFDTNTSDPDWNADLPLQLCVRLRRSLPLIPPTEDRELQSALASYIDRNCPDQRTACSTVDGRRAMLGAAPDLLRRVLDSAADLEMERAAAPRLLSLIEAQLRTDTTPDYGLFEAKEREIRKLGLRVIRVPYIAAPHRMAEWPGISYANVVEIDRTVFVPAFGLGKTEERIFADLRAKLGSGFEVVPVYARFSMLHNAGVHCVLGIVRDSHSF